MLLLVTVQPLAPEMATAEEVVAPFMINPLTTEALPLLVMLIIGFSRLEGVNTVFSPLPLRIIFLLITKFSL